MLWPFKMKCETATLLIKWFWLTGASVYCIDSKARCDRASPHAQPADGRYRIAVAGDPDLFLAGELYTVTLKGLDGGEGITPFTGFAMWVELVNEKIATEGKSQNATEPELASNHSLGTFKTYDSQSRLNERCTPAVVNATAHPKTEVQAIWSAPIGVSELCVRLCARADSISGKRSELARKLCAAPVAPAAFTRQPPIVEPCCACDEAKYEVSFDGLWSRNTHPREFPPESARAHFGDLIGASHTAQYRVWQEGRVASPGLRRLADDGATTALEKELKAESEHIRTIIKARGLSWQQVGGSTFAVFRVDARHHLVSLAAKMAPSPDWIIGVSALELCNSNCTWRLSATLPLYPYDAGTDNGVTYMSHRQPTMPAATVRALRPDWPRDARSPFYSANGEMRPFGRLRLTRLRLYEKSCDGNPEDVGEIGRDPALGGACTVHEWGTWSACSVTCGQGRATRQRRYVWPTRAHLDNCRAKLTDYQKCYGPRRHCRVPSEYEPDPAEASGPCAVSPWSEWSPCEGCGVRARTRHYLVARAHKRCHIGYRARTVMHQAIPCDVGPCVGYSVGSSASPPNNFDWFFVDSPRMECPVTKWGDWSPCSARCGRGHRLRTRFYVIRDVRVQQEIIKRLLNQWNRQFAYWQGIELTEDNSTVDDPELETKVQKRFEACHGLLTQQEALCDVDSADCRLALSPQDLCGLPLAVGPCRGYHERWFYDSQRGVCEPFGYTGCGGNTNNFRDHEECQRVCSKYTPPGNKSVTEPSKIEVTTISAKVKHTKSPPTPPPKDLNEVMQKDAPVLDNIDTNEENLGCVLGSWLGWSDCFGECEHAMKLNYRHVIRIASGDGRPCSSSFVKSRSCKLPHCRRQQLSTVAYDETTTLVVDGH